MPSRQRAYAVFLCCLCTWLVYILIPRQSATLDQESPAPQEPFAYTPLPPVDFGRLDSTDLDALGTYARSKLSIVSSPQDYAEFGLRVRLFRTLYHSQRHGSTSSSKLYAHLEQQLFGWALTGNQTLNDWHSGYRKGKGIVMAVGDTYARYAVHAVKTIRLLNCSLPIEVFHNGLIDLAPDAIEVLASLPNVRVVDISLIFNNSTLHLEQWDIKPFAVLASSFQQAILLDADTVFVQNPSLLFHDAGYVESGALFFHDRTLFAGDHAKSRWLAAFFPEPLSFGLQHTRFFQARSSHEQEAGVVVLDKHRHFIGLLTICALNLPGAKEQIRLETHGEKETFWMGLELASEEYGFLPSMPGSIGATYVGEGGKTMICGHLAHFDRSGALLWFNDGIVANKRDPEWMNDLAMMTHVSKEGTWTPYLCISGPIQALSDNELRLLERIKALFDPDPIKTFLHKQSSQ